MNNQELFNYYANRVKELETAIKWHRAWSDACAKYDDDYNKWRYCARRVSQASRRIWSLVS